MFLAEERFIFSTAVGGVDTASGGFGKILPQRVFVCGAASPAAFTVHIIEDHATINLTMNSQPYKLHPSARRMPKSVLGS
jgi:hypothetical protein